MAASTLRCLLAFACLLALGLAACRQEEDRPPGELRSGQVVAAALAPGDIHRYSLSLRQGDFLRLEVDQQGIDLVAAFEDPKGAEVLRADRAINDRGPELVMAVAAASGIHTLVIRGAEGGPGRYEARIEALRPALAADRRSAAAYRSFTVAKTLGDEEAMALWTEALATWRELGDAALEGEVLASMARQHYRRLEPQPMAERYRQSAAAFARAGDLRWEGLARANLGSALLDLGEAQEAADQYALALSLARRAKDPLTQAKALHGLGQAFQNQGELQKALDRYREALALWPPQDGMRPHTLHQLGVLYTRHFHDERRGRARLLDALGTWGPGAEAWKAATLSQLGRLSFEQGRLEEARRYYQEALDLRKDDPCGRAVYLARLARVEERQGARTAASARMAEALKILQAEECPKSETTVHLLAAGLAEGRGEPARALAGYRRCETLFADLGNRMGMAESLEGIARNARALGDRQAAREASRRALDILEGVRPTVLSEDLRISLFSGARQIFDFHIDLLRDMGAGEEAWATAERARARALGDLLAEAGAGLRRHAGPGLLAREQALQRQLNALESLRLKSESRPEQLRLLRRDVDAKIAELEALRGEIRRRSPAYASLARPEPVSLATTRRELLDGDTVLLEYRLGETSSTVWAVTREAVTAVRLPPRGEIEPRALEAAGRLRSLKWPGYNPPVLCELSRMLLAPVAAALTSGPRRLAVVADGALEVLPFAALPVPVAPGSSADCARAPLLVDSHEIVSLPSAAALLTQRRLLAGRPPAPGWLAVVADPVYDPGHSLPALPGSAQEAAAITAGLPPGKVFLATGPDASRPTVTSGRLRGFRILHFATHGILNAEQPLLSSLALSRGFLPAHEIYDLDLPAELVVLSACETNLGRDVPGEGLVSGLPRAFLYAGAARVLVSLWAVEDQSTRDLVTAFYRGLFQQGLPPARALQEAQRTLRQAGRLPYEWAGFVLVGDWRPLPPFDR